MLRLIAGVIVTVPEACTVRPLVALYRSALMLTVNPALTPTPALAAGLASRTPERAALNAVTCADPSVLPMARSPLASA